MENIGIPSLLLNNTYIPYLMSPESERFMELNKKHPTINIIISILRSKERQSGVERNLFILKGLTGCGKSTYFIDTLQKEFGGNIYCTEPTKLLCENNFKGQISLFQRTAGANLGIKTSDRSIPPQHYGHVLFLTIESLNNIIYNKISQLSKVKIVVIDEVHELSSETIISLYQIKLLLNNSSLSSCCPLFILQSATLDVEKMAEYFDINVQDPLNFANIIGSTTYPIDMNFVQDPSLPLADSIVENIVNCFKEELERVKVDNTDQYGNILIMVNSGRIIETYIYMLKKTLTERNLIPPQDILIFYRWLNETTSIDESKLQVLILELNSTNTKSTLSLTNKIITQTEKNLIKIIFSSSVAESGVTIQNVKYCIDSGYSRKNIMFPLMDTVTTQLIPETYSSFVQRRGRIGRISPGKFIGLYDESIITELRDENSPTLYSSDTFITLYLNHLKTHASLYNPYTLNQLVTPLNVDVIIEGMRKISFMNIINAAGELNNNVLGYSYGTNLVLTDNHYMDNSFDSLLENLLIAFIKSFNFSSFVIALIFFYLKKELLYEKVGNFTMASDIYHLTDLYVLNDIKKKYNPYNMAKEINKYYNVFQTADLTFYNQAWESDEAKEAYCRVTELVLIYGNEPRFQSLIPNDFSEDLTERISLCVRKIFNDLIL